MTVDFNGIGKGQLTPQKSGAEQTRESKAPSQPVAEQARPQTPASRGDSVSLSRQTKELEQKLESYPEVDDSRVEQIRAALADGSYKVDAEKLAQKMLEMDKSIFG